MGVPALLLLLLEQLPVTAASLANWLQRSLLAALLRHCHRRRETLEIKAVQISATSCRK